MNSVIQILMTVSPGIYLIPSLHLVSLPYSHVLFINLHFVCHIQLWYICIDYKCSKLFFKMLCHHDTHPLYSFSLFF